MFHRVIAAVSLGFLFFTTQIRAAEPLPDLQRLQQSGFIIGPGTSQAPVHSAWKNLAQVMRNVDAFDDVVDRVEDVVCGNDTNRSVLLVGESSLAYQYIFARLGNRPASKCAPGMWHVDINVSKIESGHRYVGDVDQYWEDSILAPSDKKSVVLYLRSVGSLIGIGSHSNDDTGIEREYVANFTSGRFRTVGYSDKYEYNDIIRSKHSYVLESFADKIMLPPVDAAQTKMLVGAYLASVHPHLTLPAKELDYLVKSIEFYQPNRQEPDRTMSVLNQMIRGVPSRGARPVEFQETIETKHPYDANSDLSWMIEKPEVQFLALGFESFATEADYDFLEVYNADTGALLDRFSGNKGAFVTGYYPASRLRLSFKSDKAGHMAGFRINRILGKRVEPYVFKHEDVRKAVMSVAQVPQWLMDRDYSVVRDLKGKLDGDVVGVAEGKKDLVRLAKNGYVAGRTDDKPIGTILFTGPTGTGKSYIAKKMAEFMGMRLITLDMTSYKDPSSFASFQEVLANHLTNTPYAMYLFEEIDKASIEVLDQLYFMMDEGVFYDSRQRPIFARGAFLMMTTNAGSETILRNKDHPDLRNMVMQDLEKSFRQSFLNRYDAISIFKPFSDGEFAQLARTMIDKKIQRLGSFYGWKAVADAATYDYVARFGRSEKYGARPMERLVEGTLGIGIGEYQLAHGAIPEEGVLAFSKRSTGTHHFRLTVSGLKSVDYTVDAHENALLGGGEEQRRLMERLRSMRDFED
ncbi:MAG: AAA family ATPase [Bdellovibrionales bacterium]|nr:AAA family ATPase [Bdellovibrionales bacterium]